MRRSFGILGIVAVTAGLLSPAYADDKDVIDYREHIMNTLNEQSAALGQILSTIIPGDNAAEHVDALALTASTALKAFEPKVLGGESKPEVWQNWADFSKRMNEFAQKMAQASKDVHAGKTDEVLLNITDALTCKSCHDVYRNEKKKK